MAYDPSRLPEPEEAPDPTFSIPTHQEGQLLKYTPSLEEFYPEDEDGMKGYTEPEQVEDSVKDM